ncbi:MAG: ribonuclease III [Thermomicrobiales bacterium]
MAALRIEGRNLDFYRTALTHRSATGVAFSSDHPAAEPNERLEFLGDALIGAYAAEELYRRYPNEPEGVLTRRRSAIVRTEQLASWAQEIELDQYMYMAPGERASASGRDRILAGAYEALIGAIYLDRGGRVAREFFNRQLKRDLGAVLAGVDASNPKGQLQELTQNLYRRAPSYRTIDAEGPAHARHFTVEVRFDGEFLATGSGSSKRLAEEDAAKAALALIEREGAGTLTKRQDSPAGS